MTFKDELTASINQLIVAENKTQYMEGKMDGLNIALRNYSRYPNGYCVHIESYNGDEASVLTIAQNKERAMEIVREEAKQFPEFCDDRQTNFSAELIEVSATNEEKTMWM